ncbi:MAG: hypothetical protein GX868_02325 [Actinobacteria bacterium]|nr:hypothetical protein [Actinomycetota bacterium]
MSPSRIILGALAIFLLLGAGVLAIRDVAIDGANCGSALLRRDPLTTRVLTGDPAEDAFQEQRITSSCDRQIIVRRFLVAAPLAGGVGCVFAGRRLRGRDDQAF